MNDSNLNDRIEEGRSESNRCWGGRTNRRDVIKASLVLATAISGPSVASATAQELETEDVTDADWTMWRFNRSNTGNNPHVGRIEALEEAWDQSYTPSSQDGNLYSPSVADGVVYYGTFDQQMHAIDAETGEQIWTASTGDIIQSSPTILEGTVYSGSHDGNIYAWDADTGDEEWSITGGGEGNRHTSVTVSRDGETIYVGSDRSAFSLVPEDGEVNWEFESPNHLVSSPTVSQGRVFFGSGAPEDEGDGYVHALEDKGDDYEEIWDRYFPNSNVRSTLAVTGNTVYFTTLGTSSIESAEQEGDSDTKDSRRDEYGITTQGRESSEATVWALDASDGSVKWKYQDGGAFSSPAVAEEKVYVGIRGDDNTNVVALDTNTGEVVWKNVLAADSITASPGYADGAVYIGDSDGTLYAFDADDGDEIDRISLRGTLYTPAISENRIYVANSNTEIFAVEGEVAEATGIGGTIQNEDEEPIPDIEVMAFRPNVVFKVLNFLDQRRRGGGEVPQDFVAQDITDENGEFELSPLDSNRYVLLINPPEDSNIPPTVEGAHDPITVGRGLTNVAKTLDERPLTELDSIFDSVFDELESVIDGNTATSAEISFEAVTEFDVIDDGIDQLADSLALLNSTLEVGSGVQPEAVHSHLENEARETAIDASYDGLLRVLRNIFDNLDEDQQEALAKFARAMVDDDWLREQIDGQAENQIESFLKSTSFYESTSDTLDDEFDRFHDLTRIEPHEDFSSSVVEDRLEYFLSQFQGDGIPGAVMTPQGEIYHYEQTEAYASSFENTQDALDAIDSAERIAHATMVAGKVLKATGKGAPIGAALWGVGKGTEMATDLAEPAGNLKLALDTVLTLVHWGVDLEDAEEILIDLIDWLETSIQEGITPVDPDDISIEVDLNLEEATVRTDYVRANRPEDPDFGSRIPLIGDDLWALEEADIEVSNFSSETINVRIGMYDIRQDAEAASNMGTLEPGPNEDPLQIEPGNTRELSVEYATADLSRIDNHEMITTLFIDGEAFAADAQTFNVRPPTLVMGSSHSEGYPVTHAGKAPNQTLTAEEEEELEPTTNVVIDTELTPDENSTSEDFTTASDTDSVSFIMMSDGIAALQIFDEQGRPVGYDPASGEIVNEIPDATYTGPDSTPEIITVPEGPNRDFVIEANAHKFVIGNKTSVNARAIETPQREALLSISPAESQRFVAPGQTDRLSIEISEVGEQVGIEGGDISIGEFNNQEGTTLPDGVDVSLSETDFELEAGETHDVDLNFDADSDLNLPENESHRFEGEVTVDTENSGSLTITVQLLVMSTDVEDSRIIDADWNVNSISLTEIDIEELDEEPPAGVDTRGAYEIESNEAGRISVALPYDANEKWTFGYEIDNGWTTVETGTDDGAIELTLSPDDQNAVFAIATNEIREYQNVEGKIEGEEARSVAEKWRTEEVDTETLQDVFEYVESGDPVP